MIRTAMVELRLGKSAKSLDALVTAWPPTSLPAYGHPEQAVQKSLDELGEEGSYPRHRCKFVRIPPRILRSWLLQAPQKPLSKLRIRLYVNRFSAILVMMAVFISLSEQKIQ